MTYKIVWEGEPRPDLEAGLRQDIERWFTGDLTPIQDMISHSYFPEGSFDGPSVGCTWDLEKEVVLAEYFAETKWVTLSELPD